MNFSHKHIFACWKTTLLGLILIGVAIAYLILKDTHESIIVFGLIGAGVAFIFSPDVLLDAIKNFIIKNKNKEL